MNDPVNAPAHYNRGGVEVTDALIAWGLDKDHFLASAVEYIVRAGHKDPTKTAEDLQKAIRNIERRIKTLAK